MKLRKVAMTCPECDEDFIVLTRVECDAPVIGCPLCAGQSVIPLIEEDDDE